MRRLLLASSSSRRRELARHLGPFDAVSPDVDEGPRHPGEEDFHYAQRLAMAKAEAGLGAAAGHHLVLAADTIVVLDDDVLGKPSSLEEARAMLLRLRDQTHKVITGVAVTAVDRDTVLGASEETIVTMRAYSDAEIDAYLATGDALDKAGAYAIQAQPFAPVESISGCYLNVVGLPVCLASRMIDGVSLTDADPAGRDPARCQWCRAYMPPGLRAYAAFL